MNQNPDVIQNLKKGTRFRAYDAPTGVDLGVYVFDQWIWVDGFQHAQCSSLGDTFGRPAGEVYKADLRQFVFVLDGCDHEWKRLDLFRTTEFHCKHCATVRPFDIEKDEAA